MESIVVSVKCRPTIELIPPSKYAKAVLHQNRPRIFFKNSFILFLPFIDRNQGLLLLPTLVLYQIINLEAHIS